MADYETAVAGEEIAGMIWDAVSTAQVQAPRTQQAANRILGMSAIGGCREFIRATIAGDPMEERAEINWPAYVGTAVGDLMEADAKKYLPGTVTQRRVTLFLQVGEQQISVSGSADMIYPEPLAPNLPPAVVDLKTRDGLTEVRREGPGFKEKAQISGYLIACIDEGLLPADAIGVLMYLDRSGRQRTYYSWSVDREQALLILSAVEARLQDVAAALATGRQQINRDEPESWCYYTGCPFYNQCWAGYRPSELIEHEEVLNDIGIYVEARRRRKEEDDVMRSSSGRLMGNTGVTPDGITLNWILQQNGSTRIDVREPKG